MSPSKRPTDARASAEESPGRSPAEWTTLALSVAILVSVVVAVLLVSGGHRDLAPIITVEPLYPQLREDASGHVLPVRIHNLGGRTAQSIVVGAELQRPGAAPESAELTVDYLAGDEDTEASFVFSERPTPGTLRLRAKSFLHP